MNLRTLIAVVLLAAALPALAQERKLPLVDEAAGDRRPSAQPAAPAAGMPVRSPLPVRTGAVSRRGPTPHAARRFGP